MKPEILHPVIREEDVRAVALAASSVGGAMAALEGLRAEVMARTGAPDCILTSSCTQALRVAIKVLISPWTNFEWEEETTCVTIPDLTFVATAHAALAAGCRLNIVDVDPITLQMRERVGADWRPGFVLPVELLGRPLTDSLVKSLAEYGVPIIVDAAQSFGVTKWRPEYMAMCISFAANKIVHGHQGGAILCSVEDGARVRQYCRQGRDASRPNDYYHVTAGENVAMNPLGAALALSQTKRIEEIMQRRFEQQEAYRRHGVMVLPEVAGNRWVHVTHAIANAGMSSDRLWEPLHRMPHLKGYARGAYPNADAAYEGLVVLPSSDDLTPEMIEENYK
jgi:dTDP-4-amino-4,6-dideoxygalactose transaminase